MTLYSAVHPIKYLESEVTWHKCSYVDWGLVS